MTTPEDPFVKAPRPAPAPGYGPPPATGGAPDGYGSPQGYGAPPTSGSAPAGYGSPPGYGAPAGYGQPGGGAFGSGTGRPELAGWGTRVLGTLIDGLAVTAIYAVFVGIGVAIGGGVGGALVLLGVLAGLAFAIYNLVQQGSTGQTIGKKQMGTRLLREQDGQVVGAGLSIGRQILHIVDGIPLYLGYLWPLWDDKKQTFADKIVKTVVVKV
ncbi:MAG TPA: RDD family protein [Mycobacteriales bacterium]|nr:RDD family protein [Mycobacteriales bacterium]